MCLCSCLWLCVTVYYYVLLRVTYVTVCYCIRPVLLCVVVTVYYFMLQCVTICDCVTACYCVLMYVTVFLFVTVVTVRYYVLLYSTYVTVCYFMLLCVTVCDCVSPESLSNPSAGSHKTCHSTTPLQDRKAPILIFGGIARRKRHWLH